MATKKSTLEHSITAWYLENKRDLPWRRTKDPYAIWVSEIMLQQTKVDTVISYYHRFLQRFPHIDALAEASEEEVLSLWQGLGYYVRARNLHRAARLIVDQYRGQFPSDYREVRSLPGIGDYTAGAILSIAFNQSYAAVDGNVLRVISRIKGLAEDISLPETKKKIARMVDEMIPEGQAGNFNQGLMELGAMICLPSAPLCLQCPVQSFCLAYAGGKQKDLPVKKKRTKPMDPIPYRVAVIQCQDRLLMEHRKEESLLGQMWGLPMVEEGLASPADILFWEKYGLKLTQDQPLASVTHVFTHRVWEMNVSSYTLLPGSDPTSTLCWVTEEERKKLAVPTAFQKVLDRI